jgi:hypothetical protein
MTRTQPARSVRTSLSTTTGRGSAQRPAMHDRDQPPHQARRAAIPHAPWEAVPPGPRPRAPPTAFAGRSAACRTPIHRRASACIRWYPRQNSLLACLAARRTPPRAMACSPGAQPEPHAPVAGPKHRPPSPRAGRTASQPDGPHRTARARQRRSNNPMHQSRAHHALESTRPTPHAPAAGRRPPHSPPQPSCPRRKPPRRAIPAGDGNWTACAPHPG